VVAIKRETTQNKHESKQLDRKMVLSLKDICLNYIAQEFDIIPNFNHALLHSADKETIIERLINHSLLDVPSNKLEQRKVCSQSELTRIKAEYQSNLVKNFFNGHLDTLRFNGCNQITDQFLRLIKQKNSETSLRSDSPVKVKLHFKSILIRYCPNLTGKILSEHFILKTISYLNQNKPKR
jgi:hypothetical protein